MEFLLGKRTLLPSNRIEPVRLSAVQLQGDGRHTGHPSYPLAYLDAPSIDSKVHEVNAWLNYKDTIGFNPSELNSRPADAAQQPPAHVPRARRGVRLV